jgi:ketosteroid isomerase-like protein
VDVALPTRCPSTGSSALKSLNAPHGLAVAQAASANGDTARSMSQENIEIVRRLQPGPEVDLTDLFSRGDDAAAEIDAAEASGAFSDDFVCIFHGLSPGPRPGLQGLRQAWLDWLEPWQSYRTEIKRLSDEGDRVLVFSSDFGRRHGMEAEVEMNGIAVWTVREGEIARAEFFPEREKALQALGLEE